MHNDPLVLLRKLSELNFYTNTEDQLNLLKELIYKGERSNIENINDKTIRLVNLENGHAIDLSKETNYSYQLFTLLKNELLQLIRENIYSNLNKEKSTIFLKLIIKELKHLLKKVNNLKTDKIIKAHLTKINTSLNTLINDISDTYLPQNTIKAKEYKIKWLGTKEQLGTLIYDLWKGQKGLSKNKRLTPLIEASKQDLKQFILDNFIGKDNSPFSPSSVDDYLNSSEAKYSAKASENRIELDY